MRSLFVPGTMAGVIALAAAALVSAAPDHPAPKDTVLPASSDQCSVRLHFRDTERVRVESDNSLEIMKKDGTVWHYHPSVYQSVAGTRRNVAAGFHIEDKDHVTVRIHKVDPSAPVVVGGPSGS